MTLRNPPEASLDDVFEKQSLDADGLRRALTRIAHEILERNGGAHDLILVGMRSRGAPLAHRLSSLISQFEGTAIPIGELDITMFRDDLELRITRPAIQPTVIPRDLTGTTVVLVQLAVIVDRGHRELPIRADYVGKNLPTARHELVEVRLREVDGIDEVVLLSHPRSGTNQA